MLPTRLRRASNLRRMRPISHAWTGTASPWRRRLISVRMDRLQLAGPSAMNSSSRVPLWHRTTQEVTRRDEAVMIRTRYPPQAGAPRRKPRTWPQKRRCRPPKPRPQRYMQLYLEQEGLCFYCRQPMQLPDAGNMSPPLPDDRVTFEHLFPSMDERHTKAFMVAACHKCNQERGSSHHWRDFMIAKIATHWRPR